jgi:hypothetical protein
MVTKFAPTVVVDGETVTPEGWMWVLGFAIAGAPWAIDQCRSEEFDLRGKIKDYNRRKEAYGLINEIKDLEKTLESLRRKLKSVESS